MTKAYRHSCWRILLRRGRGSVARVRPNTHLRLSMTCTERSKSMEMSMSSAVGDVREGQHEDVQCNTREVQSSTRGVQKEQYDVH